MKRYRPQILSILHFGIGGTVSVGILYMLSLYAPDLFSEIPKGIGWWLGFLLSWWIGGVVGIVCFGPFTVFRQNAQKGVSDR